MSLTNQQIHHCNLSAVASLADIEQLCAEAIQYKFAAVCVPPIYVKKAVALLQGTHISVSTVVGYPLGFSAVEAKVAEAVLAIIDGADAIEMVVNIAALKSNDWQYLAFELNNMLSIVTNKQKLLIVIIESGVLTEDEIIKCCDLYGVAGIHCIKTSTEHTSEGVTPETVAFIRKYLANAVKIEASGGIKNFNFAAQLFAAGANTIACGNGQQLLEEANNIDYNLPCN